MPYYNFRNPFVRIPAVLLLVLMYLAPSRGSELRAETHSADTDGNYRIGLLELTRVIELYNTRNGTNRTGCYKVDATGEDGFAPEPTRTNAATVTLGMYHSADTNQDGKINLLELTRVIELYNYRAGTQRTGDYHVQSGTEDGFAPGPATSIAPAITTQPSSQVAAPGDGVRFSVSASGSAPLQYQWKKDNVNISGATDAEFASINSAQISDTASYSVEVSNNAGSVVSEPAALTVGPPTLSSYSYGSQVVGEPIRIQIYTWGSDNPATTFAADGLPSSLSLDSKTGLITGSIDRAGVYLITINASNRCGSSAPSPLRLTIYESNQPPVATQPWVESVAGGFAIRGEACGTGPLTYQWRKNGADIPGATGDSICITGAEAGDTKVYTYVAANPFGSVTSNYTIVSADPVEIVALGVSTKMFLNPGTEPVTTSTPQVGDVLHISSRAIARVGEIAQHNVCIRRPGIGNECPPAWNIRPPDPYYQNDAVGWGKPYDTDPVDLGDREPFRHYPRVNHSLTDSDNSFDMVLDAPGAWLVQVVAHNSYGQVCTSYMATINVVNVSAPGAARVYPIGSGSKFVGALYNAVYNNRHTPAVYAGDTDWSGDNPNNWRCMWQGLSPLDHVSQTGQRARTVTAGDDKDLWFPYWGAHRVSPIVQAANGSVLRHDISSVEFTTANARRLMNVGVDFIVIDYTNIPASSWPESPESPAGLPVETVFEALAKAKQGLTNAYTEAYGSGAYPAVTRRVLMSVMLPLCWENSAVNVDGFNRTAKYVYDTYAGDRNSWFYYEDKPMLLLFTGAGTPGPEPGSTNGKLTDNYIATNLKFTPAGSTLEKKLTDLFAIRYINAYTKGSGPSHTDREANETRSYFTSDGRYLNDIWTFLEHQNPSPYTKNSATGAIECILVTARGYEHSGDTPDIIRDRFDRVWVRPAPYGSTQSWSALSADEPAEPILAKNGQGFLRALKEAVDQNPTFLLVSWQEYGSSNDETFPDTSFMVGDNNKHGAFYGDMLKAEITRFKN